MPTISTTKDDYEAVAQLAGKMQMALKKKVSLGMAAGHACRYVLSETRRVEEVLGKKVTRKL